jgi:hypothetical protein
MTTHEEFPERVRPRAAACPETASGGGKLSLFRDPRVLLAVAALLLVEGLAWWWMNPRPAGEGDAVLAHRMPAMPVSQDAADRSESWAPLPEVVMRSLEPLRCSDGEAGRIRRADGATIHYAFFEWNHLKTGSMIEAFKHLPEECLGSIGMVFREHLPNRRYAIEGEELEFTHDVFSDTTGSEVHSFKAVWVSGMKSLLGDGLRGGAAQWRTVRLRAAASRFRPAYVRVAQGAVRGVDGPDEAWRSFEEAFLRDLEKRPPSPAAL